MERHIQLFLNRISYAFITLATITFLILFFQTPQTCIPPNISHKIHHKFPKSSCDFSPRQFLSIDKKNKRLWSSQFWQKNVFSYTQFFISIQHLKFLDNDTRVVCVSAGAGHEVMALLNIGVKDVTGVELVDSPPLVSRADPHNLPFFDGAFDLAFSAHFDEALFPVKFVREMERTVRPGGICVLAVEECSDDEVMKIAGLFRNSKFVGRMNVTLIGLKTTRIIMKVTIPS